MRVNGGDLRHVLLGRERELVINHVVREESKPVQSRGWVKVHGDARATVNVLADALHATGLVEVPLDETLADRVPVGAAGDEGQLQRLHDVFELRTDFASFSQDLAVQEVSYQATQRQERRSVLRSIWGISTLPSHHLPLHHESL